MTSKEKFDAANKAGIIPKVKEYRDRYPGMSLAQATFEARRDKAQMLISNADVPDEVRICLQAILNMQKFY